MHALQVLLSTLLIDEGLSPEERRLQQDSTEKDPSIIFPALNFVKNTLRSNSCGGLELLLYSIHWVPKRRLRLAENRFQTPENSLHGLQKHKHIDFVPSGG